MGARAAAGAAAASTGQWEAVISRGWEERGRGTSKKVGCEMNKLVQPISSSSR